MAQIGTIRELFEFLSIVGAVSCELPAMGLCTKVVEYFET